MTGEQTGTERAVAARVASRAAQSARVVGRWAASIPFTWVIVGLAVLVGVLQLVFHASLYRLFDPAFSLSFDSVVGQHHWFAALTSVLFAARALHIVIVVPIILILLGSAERMLGTWRTALSYVVVAVLGSTLGLLLQGIGISLGIVAAEQVRSYATIDPITPIVGTIMVASAFAGPLVRRRIRVLGFAVLLMLALYSGMPVDLYRLLAAVVGLLLGMLLWRARQARRASVAGGGAAGGGRAGAGVAGIGANIGAGRPTRYRSTHREQRSLLAALVAITAIGPVITVVAPTGFGPLQPLGLLFRDTLSNPTVLAAQCATSSYGDACTEAHAAARLDGLGPVLVTVLPLVVLLIAALGILRGRRVALWLAVAVNLFLTLLGVVYYGVIPSLGSGSFFDLSSGAFDQASVSVFISVLVPLLIAFLLVISLPIFPVDATFGATPRFFIIIASALIVISAVYLAVAFALRAEFTPEVNLGDLLNDLPERFMPVGFLSLERVDVFPNGGAAQFVYEWVGPLFWFVVAVTAVLSVSRHRLRQEGGDAGRIRALLHEGASGSLSWITTWPGHHYWFSPEHAVAVAYRVVNGVAIATGEPLGGDGPAGEHDRTAAVAEAHAAALAQFAAFCTRHGWTPVFYVVSGELAPVFGAQHWSMMKIAEEARVDLGTFSLEGKKMQDVRTAINKATKLGIRAEWTSYSRLTLGQAAQIREISEAWVADKNLPEMGFTLGGVDELTDPEVRLMLAVDADDRVLGVTSWLPTFEQGRVVGWTLDFMRRRPGSINGIMEFTIGESILLAQREGLRFVSLSAAPLAHTGDPGGSAGERGARAALLDVLGRALEPVYGFQSLLAFKQKFRPQNVPLYLAYADPLTLPAVGVALARAYVPTLSARQTIRLLAARNT